MCDMLSVPYNFLRFAEHALAMSYRVQRTLTVFLPYAFFKTTLKKISEREDQYLYVARRTFTNLFL